MGLSLAVFKSVQRLADESGARCTVVDPETGEASVAGVEHSFNEVAAISERIGNVAMLCHLRERVKSHLGTAEGVVSQLLMSGSGEAFGGEKLRTLRSEIHELRGCPDVEVQVFCEVVQRALEVASAEGNPLVTV